MHCRSLQEIECEENQYTNNSTLEHVLAPLKAIWEYDVNQHNDAHRDYINMGAYQPMLKSIQRYGIEIKIVDFNLHCSQYFLPLEYSITQDKVLCLPYFLF